MQQKFTLNRAAQLRFNKASVFAEAVAYCHPLSLAAAKVGVRKDQLYSDVVDVCVASPQEMVVLGQLVYFVDNQGIFTGEVLANGDRLFLEAVSKCLRLFN